MFSITIIIIAITCVVSLISFNKNELQAKLMFNPYLVSRGQYYRIFTHAFIHGDYVHLFFNMYVLFSFGNIVENTLLSLFGNIGYLYYAILYIGGITFATIPGLKKHKDNIHYNAVGASGAVSAVLFSSIIFNPTQGGIGIIFIPIFLPPFIFGIVYLIFEWYMNQRRNSNIAHDAHIFGAIYGVIFTLILGKNIALNFINQIINYFGS